MILLNGSKLDFRMFPNGESLMDFEQLQDLASPNSEAELTFKYEHDQDLIHLMFIKKYLDSIWNKTFLHISYMPYSRMDRSENGSPFTLKYVAEFINGLGFKEIIVSEPHSDITPALLNNVQVHHLTLELLSHVMQEVSFNRENDFLFFPDAGAQKRYSKVSGFNELVGFKKRNFETGKIEGLNVVGNTDQDFTGKKVIIVDDLSSYGGTFVRSSEQLKRLGFSEIYLVVAHAENSIHKGDLFKFDSYIDMVFTTDSMLTMLDEEQPKLKVYNLVQK